MTDIAVRLEFETILFVGGVQAVGSGLASTATAEDRKKPRVIGAFFVVYLFHNGKFAL